MTGRSPAAAEAEVVVEAAAGAVAEVAAAAEAAVAAEAAAVAAAAVAVGSASRTLEGARHEAAARRAGVFALGMLGSMTMRRSPLLATLALCAAPLVLVSQPAVAQAPVLDCDRLAAHPADPSKVAPGVQWDLMDARAGIRACEDALLRYPGEVRFKFQLGRALLRAERRDEGLPYLFEAAEQDYLVAFANIGGTYQFDLGNYGEALKWYRRGAERGDVSSQTHLAEMYQEGWGVERDLKEALRWYAPSAEAGYPLAEYKIGVIYLQGDRNVRRDPEKAVSWFRRAADHGFARAQNDLGWAYETGDGVDTRRSCGPRAGSSGRVQRETGPCGDFENAAIWYRRAAEQGWARAQTNLARLYENGLGVERDLVEAVYWYRLASDARIDQIQDLARSGVRRLQSRLNSSELVEVDRRVDAVRYVTAAESEASIKRAAAQGSGGGRSDGGDAVVDTDYVPPAADDTVDAAYVPPEDDVAAAAATQPVEPARDAFTVVAMNDSMIALKNANVRAAPTTEAAKIGRLQKGEVLAATGKVEGRNWYRVALADDGIGYVFGTLLLSLSEAAETTVARAEPEPATATREAERASAAPAEREVASADPAMDLGAIDFGRYHALVIGNNDYTEFPRLKTAVNDARAVAETLERDYGYEVKLLLNATREDIVLALDRYRASLGSNDNMLIYYAGHGYLDSSAERGYWLPVDASPDTKVRWVSNATITDTLKAMVAKHVMLVVDSCYSGTLTRGVSVTLQSPDYIERMAAKRARVVLTSGGLEPVSDSGIGGRHSVFAEAFLEALRSNQSLMDGTELFLKIRRPVMVNVPQTPEYADIRFAGHAGGDFLFVKK